MNLILFTIFTILYKLIYLNMFFTFYLTDLFLKKEIEKSLGFAQNEPSKIYLFLSDNVNINLKRIL